ncbi:MAG TPA: YceI family protein [Haliangiales bacterium]|nr:YceI family protein [Haliangiales bacterium]
MPAERYDIDTVHSGIHFTVRHMVIAKVRGKFNRWSGSVLFDKDDPTLSSVDVKIEAASIDTGIEDRDNHLRSPDFFDAAGHPELTFRSKRVERIDDENLRVVGDLTIRGTTREVALATELNGATADPWGAQRVGFSARAAVNRHDFGLKWNSLLETGGAVVGDQVKIELEVEAVKKAA